MISLTELFDRVDEALKRKKVVRGGKRKILKKTDKKGYKTVGGKEVRMTAREKINRARAQKKAARKRKPTQAKANRKRAISNRKRT